MAEIGIKLYDNTLQSIGTIKPKKVLDTLITTIVDYQELAEIEIFRIEDNRKDYFAIGGIKVNNIPRAKAGEPRIKLTVAFESNEDMIISVFLNGEFKNKIVVPSKNWQEKDTSHFEKDHQKKEVNLDFINKTTTKGDYFVSEKKPEEKKPEEEEGYIPDASADKGNPVLKWLIPILIVIFVGVLIFVLIKVLPRLSPEESTVSHPTEAPIAKPTEKPTPRPTAVPTVVPTAIPTEIPTAVPQLNLAEINQQISIILPLYFVANQSKILPEYGTTMDKLAKYLSQYKGQVKVEIIGHTADSGTLEEQQLLSVARAEWVKNELLRRGAVSAADCSVIGKGFSEPVYNGKDSKQFYRNRRIEVIVHR